MTLEKYDFEASEDFKSFTFKSVGPKGIIKKVINFQLLTWHIGGIRVVNLAFGDWNDETKKIDDSTVSNNGDREKVLATIASTVLLYTEKHARVAIYAVGITSVKTRLYQMSINAHLADIEQIFMVFGLIEEIWVPFKPGYNYEAFLILKK